MSALLLLRLILALMFAVAGCAKAADPAGSRKAVAGFGVPELLAGPVAWALPIGEILIAVLLLPLATAWYAAIAALALLAVFEIAIAVNLAQGKTPDCHCFGQVHSDPVSWWVFGRNLVFAALAGLLVLSGRDQVGASLLACLADLQGGQVLIFFLSMVAIGLLVATIRSLRRVLTQQAAILDKVDSLQKALDGEYGGSGAIEHEGALPPTEGLPVGAPAPDFSLTTLAGTRTSLADLLALGNATLLLFVSPSCQPCKMLLALVQLWEREYSRHLTFVVISRGTPKENEGRMASYKATHLLLEEESGVAEAYQAKWTPAALLLTREGKIASAVSSGEDAIKSLVKEAAAAALSSNGHLAHVTLATSLIKVGDPTPTFSLSDLSGNKVSNESLLGQPTLLLFWNPHCPFCEAMKVDLRRREEHSGTGGPRLVYLSSGQPEQWGDKHKVESLTLVDQDFKVGPLFGASGTPSAVLLDAKGKIASSVATGAPNILALVPLPAMAELVG